MSNTAPDTCRYGPSLVLVWLSALVAQAVISFFELDCRWAEWLFQLEGGSWRLRTHWLLTDWIHEGGRSLSVALALACILLWLASGRVSRLYPHRRVLAYLALAPLLSAGLVSLGKHTLGGDCPWSLQPFGGDQPYRSLLAQLLESGGGECFPAGHASAGYAWLALGCAAVAVTPRLLPLGLGMPLLLGLVFGLGQQLRGAHFLSHDLWSLVLCWTVSVLLARVMLNPATGWRGRMMPALNTGERDGYECVGGRR